MTRIVHASKMKKINKSTTSEIDYDHNSEIDKLHNDDDDINSYELGSNSELVNGYDDILRR